MPIKNDKITKDKIEKYKKITSKAFEIAKESIIKGKKEQAKEIIDMVSNYLTDAVFFEKKGDFVNAFAAINYAHGWLDSGVRFGVFSVDDSNLFTIK